MIFVDRNLGRVWLSGTLAWACLLAATASGEAEPPTKPSQPQKSSPAVAPPPQKPLASKSSASDKSRPDKTDKNAKKQASPGTTSLDEQLLEELSQGLFDPVEEDLFRQGLQGSASKKKAAPEKQQPAKNSRSQERKKNQKSVPAESHSQELVQPEGEDIGPDDNPLTSISRQMRQVQQRLAQGQVDEETLRLQREIVARLEKLLRQMNRRRRSSSSSSSASRRQQSGAQSQPQAQSRPTSSPAGGTQAANRPAARPNPQPKQTQAQRPKPPAIKSARAMVQDLLKRIWGHLPPRMRQQMLQSAGDRFLPQYELEIEEYFRRVSNAGKEKP